MTKFFRRIRQQLMSENKFTTYLIYAVGEIVLVVIGILIALSINNWNHNQQERKKESSYLDKLEVDLRQQLTYIDNQLKYEHKYIDNARPLLDRFRTESVFVIDSTACIQLKVLMERKTFITITPTYQDLITTGNIDLISDEILRNELLRYYSELERFEKIIQSNNTLHVDEMYAQNLVEQVYLGSDFSPKFIVQTNNLLKEPSRQLTLYNIIDFRSSIAVNHVNFMEDLKHITQDMLDLLGASHR